MKKLRRSVMAKPNNQTKKMFAISSIIGAILMSSNNGDPKLTALKVQIDKAMKVFSVKAPKQYYTISSDVKEVWEEMAKQHNNTLDEDEINVFIEMIANLVPRNDFKTFLGVNTYKTIEKIRDSRKSALLVSVLELDSKLNSMFGTARTATRDSISKILTKPIKILSS
jgi:hypothetical protein